MSNYYEIIDDCEHCGGDGEFCEPAAWTAVEGTIKCEVCKGRGWVTHLVTAAGEEWIDVERQERGQ